MTLVIDMIGGNCPVQAEGTEWLWHGSWGDGSYAAGWMPESEARRLIEWCASEFARVISTDEVVA